MAVKMRRNFSGAFRASIAANTAWRITRNDAPEIAIIVTGADATSIEACGTRLYDPSVEWQGQRALLRCAGQPAIEARSVIVHEPQPNLYSALPLAKFDDRARRFWRRVFLLVRIPGGQRLLGMLAHASRNKA
jgi:hypothetical protein